MIESDPDFDPTERFIEPVTLRERIAYALAAHDTFHGQDGFTRLLDEELAELTHIITYLHSPVAPPNHGQTTGWVRTLVKMERKARGWDRDNRVVFMRIKHAIVERTWREWLPMADACLTVLTVFPEVAARLKADLDSPTVYPPPPDPIPDPPLPPPGLQTGPKKPPPKRRAKKAA